MKGILKFQLQAAAALAVFLVSSLLFGCTTFRGPGQMKTAGEYPHYESDGADEIFADQTIWSREHKSAAAAETVAFNWPVAEARLSQPFHLDGRRPHFGIDLANKRGTRILASEKGYVIYTGRHFRGYGNLVVIEHNNEWATLYSHLDKITVSEGAYVQRGDELGTMGRTGRASGVHLHFEIRHNRVPVNPEAYLPVGLQAMCPAAMPKGTKVGGLRCGSWRRQKDRS